MPPNGPPPASARPMRGASRRARVLVWRRRVRVVMRARDRPPRGRGGRAWATRMVLESAARGALGGADGRALDALRVPRAARGLRRLARRRLAGAGVGVDTRQGLTNERHDGVGIRPG